MVSTENSLSKAKPQPQKLLQNFNNSFPVTLTVLVHQEEDEEGVVVEEAIVGTVTKGDVEVPHVVKMDLHANEHSVLPEKLDFLHVIIVEAKDTRAQLQRFCTNLTF